MDALKVNKGVIANAIKNEPKKCVKTLADLPAWLHSKAYFDLLGFINGISDAIQGIRLTSEMYVSENLQKLLDIFDVLNRYIDETPPLEQQYRFGNKAYRSWSRKINQDSFLLLQKAFPEDKCELVNELGTYFVESFGNATRIDYGTGHELSFMFFLCGLFMAEILREEDNIACALKLFNKYLLLVRRLQTTYRMEPAGSQGVWSLDDFQFIPFIWGSAQLSFGAPFDPPKFLDDDIIEKYKDEYMFISCIDYIKKVKTGHFAEHSNQLWSISAVPTWPKIYVGLLKMYPKEILGKFPVIQHAYFGKLMSFDPAKSGTVAQMPRLGFIKPTNLNIVTKKPAAAETTERTIETNSQEKLEGAASNVSKTADEKQPEETNSLEINISEDEITK